MIRRIQNEKLKRMLPYLLILAGVLFLEIFVFNFSTWKTLGCDPVMLAQEVRTDDEGAFSTGFIEINDEVKNVNVELSVERYDRAEVLVELTDEGDYYAYALPAYTVVPGVKGCGYRNIYPFGKVSAIRVTVTVPEGIGADIASVTVNHRRPFSFKLFRVLLLSAVAALGYLFFTDASCVRTVCSRSSLKQFVITVAVMAALVLFAGRLVTSNPVCVSSPWPHHRQYQELARAIECGTVVIDDKPAEALLQKENPYDTSALIAEGIPYRMDYALYNGKYYAYFGIVPELLFFLPYYLATGRDLPNYLAVFALYMGLTAGVFGTFWEMAHRFAQKLPFACYLLLSVSVSLLPNYVFMLGRPDIYNIPIMAGNACVFLGTFCWLKGMSVERRKWLWYGLGALCIACIAGCRPQLLLYGVVLFAAFLLPGIWENKKRWKSCIRVIIAFFLPILLVGLVVFGYNLARFGSGFDFGATYSLTSNDMNHRGFNFSRLARGLYSFLFQPPVLSAEFPFLESCELEGGYMGKNIVEFCYGGIFATFPLLFSLFYPLFGGRLGLWQGGKGEETQEDAQGERKRGKCILVLLAGLCIASFVIAAFDINSAGVLQRYMGDMVFGFVASAALVWMLLLDKSQGERLRRWLLRGVYCCVICGAAFSFLVIMASGDTVCLENGNPALFYRVASYFWF